MHNKTDRVYKVGAYIRISKEDVDKENNESYSVTNQKLFIESYVKEQNYVLIDTYIDDGYTGTNFDRPAFIRMIKDIELGKIDMVITKDLSRLGRIKPTVTTSNYESIKSTAEASKSRS